MEIEINVLGLWNKSEAENIQAVIDIIYTKTDWLGISEFETGGGCVHTGLRLPTHRWLVFHKFSGDITLTKVLETEDELMEYLFSEESNEDKTLYNGETEAEHFASYLKVLPQIEKEFI